MAGVQRKPTARRDQYKLMGVQVLNDRVISSGPYTTDLELEYVGLKCIGKKLHQALFMQGETTTKVRQLKEQCHLLSQIRHPNIVMFLGLFFQQSPILVMEYVPYHLASCIDQYGTLPADLNYSILQDVALGLTYLHHISPTVVHGELTTRNVLLTPDMTAKIAYQGEAKILRLTQADISNIALKSATNVYIAPELMTNSGQIFNPSMDIYSYGVIMLHTLTGKHPHATSGTASTPSSVIAEHVKLLDENHPLMTLILGCTNTNPQVRPQTDELVKALREMVAKFPFSFSHRLEMIRLIQRNQEAKTTEKEVSSLQGKIREKRQGLEVKSQELTKLKSENELLRKKLIDDSELANKAVQELRKLQTQQRT